MAQRPAPSTALLWQLFEQLDDELQRTILELIGGPAARSLRRAFRAGRALANSRVERIRLPAAEIGSLPLRLHERFPRLARLELVQGDVNIGPDAFADFAVAELARLASLVELALRGYKSLGTGAAMALRECCPQLQALDLHGTGAGSSQQCVVLASHQRLQPTSCARRSRRPLPTPQVWRAPTRCRCWPASPA
jgi:hypothetical protein